MLMTLGWSGWLPRRWRRWVLSVIVLLLFGLSAAAPFVWIRPAYAMPRSLTGDQSQAIPHRRDVDFDGTMRLLGYDIESTVARPGDDVAVVLYWEALGPTEEDHTIFVHLLGKHDLLIAQRDTFPGLGLLSTTRLKTGFRWADRYVLQLPDTTYAPDRAQIEVGLFNAATGRRLPISDSKGNPPRDNVRFGQVHILARSSNVPNPSAINFGDRMLLSGYDLSERAAQPGDPITLTLFWTALRSMEHNYTVSAQLVDPTQRKAGQHDAWPVNGAAPTTSWSPGQRVTDTIPLKVFADAPAGTYSVRIAVYLHQDSGIVHLPVTPPGGRMQADHVLLTRVRVMP
jgi:hypothetical protein